MPHLGTNFGTRHTTRCALFLLLAFRVDIKLTSPVVAYGWGFCIYIFLGGFVCELIAFELIL